MIWTHLPIFNYCFDFVDIFAYVQKLRGVNDTVNPNVFCNFSKFSSSIKRGCFTKFSTLFFHGSNSFVPKIYADRFVVWKTFCLLLHFFLPLFLGFQFCLKDANTEKRKQSSENGTETELITWTAGHRNGKIWNYIIDSSLNILFTNWALMYVCCHTVSTRCVQIAGHSILTKNTNPAV